MIVKAVLVWVQPIDHRLIAGLDNGSDSAAPRDWIDESSQVRSQVDERCPSKRLARGGYARLPLGWRTIQRMEGSPRISYPTCPMRNGRSLRPTSRSFGSQVLVFHFPGVIERVKRGVPD